MVKQVTNLLVWLASGGLLLACLAFVALATPLVGNRALIVRSGSMEPAISVGDIVIVRPGTYQTGDAIAYNVPGKENMVVTHRIVEVKQGEYVTKGDANSEKDSWAVSEKDILGKELFTVPWVGTLLAFAKSRVGFMSLVVAPALVVVLSEVRVIWREMRKRVPRLERGLTVETATTPGESPSATLAGEIVGRLAFIGAPSPPVRRYVDGISLRVAVIIFMVAIMTPATFALYTDTGTSSNNTFTAAEDFGFGTDHIVISEVQIQGTNPQPTDKDFVELYNPTDSLVDISGWNIRKKNASGTESSVVVIGAGKSIPAHGFFLWANDSLSVGADESNGNTLGQNNSVALFNDDSTPAIVDQVAWGDTSNPQFVEGTEFPTSPDGGASIERKALSTSTTATMIGADAAKGNGFDSDDNATDFTQRAASQPQNSGSAIETP